MAMQYHLTPPMQRTMGGANPHTPQSVFQHMMGQQNASQQAGPWLQMPQVPTLSMPWSVTTYQQPDLIRFTGERNQTMQGTMLHLKRKLDTPDIADTRQAKQFISEEKMASHFQELHISSNSYKHNTSNSTSTVIGQPACENSQYTSLNLKSNEPVDIDQNEYSPPRLIISEELKLLKEEPLIPPTLLSKLDRPSMALVLWEPPSKHLARVLPTPPSTQLTIENTIDDSNNNNNNNNNVSNNNNNNRNNNNNIGIADLNESCAQLLEPMEL